MPFIVPLHFIRSSEGDDFIIHNTEIQYFHKEYLYNSSFYYIFAT